MKQKIFLLCAVAAAVITLFVFGAQVSSEPDFTVFSTESNGCGLIYDTLREMGYPVAVGYMPVDESASVQDAHLIINPNQPEPDEAAISDMLNWVTRGGRLVYLDDITPTLLDEALYNAVREEAGNMTRYQLGLGQIITGDSDDFTNQYLMENINTSPYGLILQLILDTWDSEHIFFNEYYHGYRAGDNFFAGLPETIKLAVYQIIIAAAAAAWHFGKRFGKAVPHYEEIERGENEHVIALARLYGYAEKRSKKREA